MKAVCVHVFGGIEALSYEELPRPAAGAGQVLVRVAAAGVGPWDAWVREGKGVLPQPLPLVPGSDFSGTVVELGPGIRDRAAGDPVFGITNNRFTGAYAEYAVADSGTIAGRPARLGDAEAASLPVVATTAWHMVFDYARVAAGQHVLVQGGAGNVGAFAVQLAAMAGAQVAATARTAQLEYVRSLGAAEAIDAEGGSLAEMAGRFDAVLDTVGGDTLQRSFALLRPGGALVSSAAVPDQKEADRRGVRAMFFLVAVSTAGLDRIACLVAAGRLRPASARCCRSLKPGWRTKCWPDGRTSPAKSSSSPDGDSDERRGPTGGRRRRTD
jgi:NADPH:quinone reductase-like Zn-dependent oxidoreductase